MPPAVAPELGPPEDILIYFEGASELRPPRPFRLERCLFQAASEGVYLVTINTGLKLNALDSRTLQELLLVSEHVARDDRVRVVVWTGTGRAFTAGLSFSPHSPGVPAEILDGYVRAGITQPPPDSSLWGLTRSMVKQPKLSIAAVNGLAIGGGMNFALLVHDLVYVAETAIFKVPFAEMGIPPELASSFLIPKRIGPVRAKEMLFLGREISAKEALEFGLCNAVMPSAEVLPKALEAARRLASMPRKALALSKQLVNRPLVDAIDAVTDAERAAHLTSWTDPETIASLTAFGKRILARGKAKL